MADEKVGIGIPLSSTADTSGADKMADALDKTKEKAKDAGAAAQTTKVDFQALGESLRTLVEGAGLIEFLRESIQEFYEDEKAIRSVTGAAVVFGQDQSKAREETEKWTHALALLSGIADNDLTAAVGKAYLATGNLHEAMSRVSLATDIATRMGWDFGKSMTIVEQAVNGQGRELAKLVPEIKGAKDQHEAAQIAVDGLTKRFHGATEATKDNALASDQARVKWQLFQKEIGSSVLPAINWVRDALSDAVLWFEKWTQKAGVWFETLTARLSAFGTMIEMVLHGRLKEADDFISARLTSIAKAQEETLSSIDKDFVDKKKKNAAELLAIVKAGAADEIHVNEDLKQKKEKLLDEHGRYMVAEFEREQRLLAQRQAAYAKHILFVRTEEQKLVDDFQKGELKKIEIEEQTRKVSEGILKHTLAMKKEAAKEELKMQVDIANGAIGVLTGVFGEQKEFSIAQAIINTYEGATKALAQGGIYGAILAAVVIAAGLVQIAKIESTEPASAGTISGAGFDDPSNDRAAYMGGRKWANDMIREFSGGASSVSQGWSAGMGGSSTTNNSSTTNYNISGGLIDPNSREWMKQFARRLDLVRQQDGQRTIARKT